MSDEPTTAPGNPHRRRPSLGLLALGAALCACAKDDCADFAERAEALSSHGEFDCGRSEYEDDPLAHEIAACLENQLTACEPASGRFFARPDPGEYWTIYHVVVDAKCKATVLLIRDPAVPGDAYTEVRCDGVEATGDAEVIALGGCGEKIAHASCED